MHITISLDDQESHPRTFLIEPTSASHILVPRLLRAIRTCIGANRVTVDTLSGVSYPSIPEPDAEKFQNAYLALYLNPEAFRELMANPEKFPTLLRRFQPKEPKR